MFQISALYDVRNPIKDTPVHHLQVGSLEDMCVSSTLLSWSWETIPNWLLKHQNPSTVCKILMYRNTWLINYTVCPSYLYPPGGGRGGGGRSCSWADKYAEGFHFLNEPFPNHFFMCADILSTHFCKQFLHDDLPKLKDRICIVKLSLHNFSQQNAVVI